MNHSIKRIITIIPCLFIFMFSAQQNAHAQLGDIGDFLQAGSEDATKLTRAYLSPLPTGMAAGLNSGWNGSAAPKKTLGFNLDFKITGVLIPSGDQSFDVNNLNLSQLSLAAGENPEAPTLAGSNSNGPQLVYTSTNQPAFQLPSGTGVSLIPAPMIQAGIGLIKDTDITVRFVPEVEVGDYGDFSVIGGSVKHGLTQYLPAEKLIPVDISLQVGYTQVNLNANLEAAGAGDQRVETTTTAWVVNALVGKSLPVISFYGGLGIQGGSQDVDVLGTFDVDPGVGGPAQITDPISYTAENDATLHVLGGFRLRLGVLTFYGEGTVGNFTAINAGVGLSFR